MVVPVARTLDPEAEYRYLERSIATFATGAQQEALARLAGFTVARPMPSPVDSWACWSWA